MCIRDTYKNMVSNMCSALLSCNQDICVHTLAPSFNRIFLIMIYGSQGNVSEFAKKYFFHNRKKNLLIKWLGGLTTKYNNLLLANGVHVGWSK